MNTQDYQPFVQEFKRLSAALERFQPKPDEMNTKADAYFHVLKRHLLSDVIAKADTWLASETRMPKPVEWANVIARRQAVAEYRTMTDAESREYAKAEAAMYQALPCECAECVHAGVSDKPLRFVPDLDRNDYDVKVRDGLRDRIVTAGHWAHGSELAGYYRAKDEFFGKFRQWAAAHAMTKKKRKRPSFRERLDAIFAVKTDDREPGQEG